MSTFIHNGAFYLKKGPIDSYLQATTPHKSRVRFPVRFFFFIFFRHQRHEDYRSLGQERRGGAGLHRANFFSGAHRPRWSFTATTTTACKKRPPAFRLITPRATASLPRHPDTIMKRENHRCAINLRHGSRRQCGILICTFSGRPY